ncbi:hypothetical protein BM536_027580 [Streptomyces phaeoluteigriseus]|uniref:Uncharacterized protein n=1 Tax=Streptomyces phaeoluteigriseus TaxID=114686 RepID=A0A1V6MLN6_9ACTN|nr:hypothetical protein BM536_027580 [Streptomyces phaeoluteigriseus]
MAEPDSDDPAEPVALRQDHVRPGEADGGGGRDTPPGGDGRAEAKRSAVSEASGTFAVSGSGEYDPAPRA